MAHHGDHQPLHYTAWSRSDYINEVLHENQLDDTRNVTGANAKGSGGFSASASGASLTNNPTPDDWEEGLTFTAKPTCKCASACRVCRVCVCVITPISIHPCVASIYLSDSQFTLSFSLSPRTTTKQNHVVGSVAFPQTVYFHFLFYNKTMNNTCTNIQCLSHFIVINSHYFV